MLHYEGIPLFDVPEAMIARVGVSVGGVCDGNVVAILKL